ncbi:MAG: hypothetical protein HY033_06795 [Ignavibacteriae bacterium]|nr:hypothetical protein [Ignavibacteria bacterium]MBI3364600.1 hypothetical protein [Ignavibacteriota bacterium]
MKLFFVISIAFFLLSCQRRSELVSASDQNIFIEVRGLPPLAPGEGQYEAWLGFANPFMTKSAPGLAGDSTLVSIGKFAVDAVDHAFALDGKPFVPRLTKAKNLQYALDAFISIEPEGDTDARADSLIIGGEFTGNVRVGIAKLSASYREIAGSLSPATATVTIYR